MELYFSFVAFVFGAIIGSFLDVVAYRFHTKKSLNGRSHCLSCGKTLAWYELIPVISYLALRGHCSRCKARIPLRCFLMEIATGSAFLLIYTLYAHDLVLMLAHFAVAAVLILIVAYDLRHTIIPDELVILLGLIAVGIVSYMGFMEEDVLKTLLSHAAAGAAAAAFLGSFWLVSRGRWMGLGDAKLMFVLGLLLGPWATFFALLLAFWLGAAISIAIIALQKLVAFLMGSGTTRVSFFGAPLKIKSEIPFAPFLVLGFSLVHFFHVDLLQALTFTPLFW